jgi:hypothetical protein
MLSSSIFFFTCTKIWGGEWKYNSTILDSAIRWRWVVSLTPRPFYFRGNSARYPMNRRLGGFQIQSGCYEEEEKLNPARIPSLAVQPTVRRYTDWTLPAPIKPIYLCVYLDSFCTVKGLRRWLREIHWWMHKKWEQWDGIVESKGLEIERDQERIWESVSPTSGEKNATYVMLKYSKSVEKNSYAVNDQV